MLTRNHRVRRILLMRLTSPFPMTRKMYFIRQSILILLIAFLLVCTLQINQIHGEINSGSKNVHITKQGNNNNTKSTENDMDLKNRLNLERQNFLQKQCNVLGYNKFNKKLTKNQMDHILVDHRYKVLYCYVPKVACTNWKRVLMILSGKWKKDTDPSQIPHKLSHSVGMFKTLRSLNETERNAALKNYKKFMFVRNPFERLLSAYRNKIEDKKTHSSFFNLWKKLILKSRDVNSSKHAQKKNDDISFAEFVKFILTAELKITHHKSHNEHWEPMSKLCNPCVMQYNVIGKYETLLDDSNLILNLIGANNITFPSSPTKNTEVLLQKYYDTLPLGDIRHLYELYADDFKLFNYGLDNVLGFESK